MLMLGMRMKKMVVFNVAVYEFYLSIYQLFIVQLFILSKKKTWFRELTFKKYVNNKHNSFKVCKIVIILQNRFIYTVKINELSLCIIPTIFHQILIVIHEANMNLYICDCLCAGHWQDIMFLIKHASCLV